MPKSDSSSPDKLVDRENSACSVDTVESYSGKDGKGKEKGKSRDKDLKKLFSLPDNEVRHSISARLSFEASSGLSKNSTLHKPFEDKQDKFRLQYSSNLCIHNFLNDMSILSL